ncbi:MAG: tRNA uridine-5-carboxymethylaminomethyl(34) synthesis GTPase MnmE, partial [Candidatus Omnitrophica bacterium]|nr:tRNA uridine-5-carboxymethylaminomethyl(34) synthesis GTPase MnmE [Candidatus Omnitrophota bacterium]
MQKEINLNDTIAAVATPCGESGIGIVRISGRRALSIADKVFVSQDGRKPSSFKTYTTHYGWIVNRSQKSEVRSQKNLSSVFCPLYSDGVIDEVILTVMRSPKSYTREDTVEINCHGGIIPLRKTLELVLDSGARLSRPGEFTQRAFLNGRIDLTQAEAVLDIIRAKSDYALSVSMGQLKGLLSNKLSQLRKKVLSLLSILEVNIEFPDQDLPAAEINKISCGLKQAARDLELILENASQGRVLREGIKAVICGKPNVGKSSLLNALLKCERSIVTPLAGTTRDTIEEVLDIKGIPVRVVDTAGIIQPRDLIERKAVSRSRRYIKEADLVLLVFDGSKNLSQEDRILMRKVGTKPTIALVNKIDLRQKLEDARIRKRFKGVVRISAKKLKNIDLLEEAVARFV